VNALDRALAYLSPALAARRLQARGLLDELSRAYEAARPGPHRPNLYASGASANAAIETDAVKLRQYARWQDENSDIAVAILDTLVNGVIGAGLQVIPTATDARGEPLAEFNESLLKAFLDWHRWPEVTHSLPGGEAQRLLCRAWLRDGEVFARHVEGARAGLDGPLPYWFELIESDLCPHELNDARARVVQGVRLNGYNRPRAYYFHREPPGDPFSFPATYGDLLQIPAADIAHLRLARRFPQVRGVTVFASVMRRLEDTKALEDYERISAKVQAAFSWYIQKDPTAGPLGNLNTDSKRRELGLKPGLGFELNPGESVGTIDAKRPNEKLIDFIRDSKRTIAGATGASFSEFARDFRGTYSSQRQELVYQDGVYDRLRHQFTAVAWGEIYRRAVQWAMVSGAVSMPRRLDPSSLFDAVYLGPPMPCR